MLKMGFICCPECTDSPINYHYSLKKAADQLAQPRNEIDVVEISCSHCGHIFSVMPVVLQRS